MRARADKQCFVDAVFALDAEGLQFTKAQLGVEPFGLVIVVQYGQVQVAEASAHKVLNQVAHQHLANTGSAAVRVYRQAPEAAAVIRVLIGLVMIKAHDAADYCTAFFILSQPIHRASQVARGEFFRFDGQHAA